MLLRVAVAQFTSLAVLFLSAATPLASAPVLTEPEVPLAPAAVAPAAARQLSAGCPSSAPVKRYEVSAIAVEVTLNRWGDFDPVGRMYALDADIPAIRAQEERNRQARTRPDTGGVEQGLLDDPIQPLALRANLGECVEIQLTNRLDEPASLHIQGAAQIVKRTGEAATAANPDAIAQPGQAVTYQWFIDPAANQEGILAIRPSPAMRDLNNHGLFGAFVVEPARSRYLHNKTGAELCRDLSTGLQTCESDWRAMIDPGQGPDFREFVLIYHEIGNDAFQPLNREGQRLALVGLAGSYGVAKFAINYRSEPFDNRLRLQRQRQGFFDESMGLSSYVFGDPGQAILRAYLGDPAKLRLLHGGTETQHVHHLHGGGVRWPRQPGVPGAGIPIDAGLTKEIPEFQNSTPLDSQSLAPSEGYDTEPYCGSGGCQQGPGDYLIHCHVSHHYVSGMWGFWRVYNTLRVEGEADPTDRLGALAELPDRAGRVARAVTSDQLIGRTVNFGGELIAVTPGNLADLVERQLPPQGVPEGYDASVHDWVRVQNRYLNEPNESFAWPNLEPIRPGRRPAIEFDPLTGKLAYPWLRPHFGKRPPFAPGHGPAAFFDPQNAVELPEPGERDNSLCPRGAPRRRFNLIATPVDIPITDEGKVIEGELYLLREEAAAVRAGAKRAEPLAIRGNKGDCVDLTLVTDIPNAARKSGFAKVNLHQHFVQFDIQSTDGVIVGQNYEQSVRPFNEVGKRIVSPASAGAGQVQVDDVTGLHPNILVMVGIDQDETFEIVKIARIQGNRLILDRPLQFDHRAGELLSPEFVRQRWFLDQQVGTVYFHDHVAGIESWPRGLVAAVIIEPPGSTFHDPATGTEIRSGTLADIRTDAAVTPRIAGSFREAVAFIMDESEDLVASVNLRGEPLDRRRRPNPALAFSSVLHGDPFTLLPRAYAGDPVVFRLLTASAEDVNTFRLTGHTFSLEPFAPVAAGDVDIRDAVSIGISQREDAHIESAGGPRRLAGDYLWSLGDQLQLVEGGAWGIFRVHDSLQPDLQPLPGRPRPPAGPGFPRLRFTGQPPPPATGPGNPCPRGAPERRFDVSAIQVDIPLNPETGAEIGGGAIYVLDQDIGRIRSGRQPIEPLAIRANAGDCVVIRFTNRLPGEPASFHAGKLIADPQGSLGITVGFNPDQTVAPGRRITHRLFADRELGTAMIRDFGNTFENPGRGLYGALVVEPRGSQFLDPGTGRPLASGNAALITQPGRPGFREFVVQFQDGDERIGTHIMAYRERARRLMALNYRIEPLEPRLERVDGNTALAFDRQVQGDPATPVFRAAPGEAVRLRVLKPFGEQTHVLGVEGHQWPQTPGLAGSQFLHSRRLGTQEIIEIELVNTDLPGDFLFLDQRLPFLEAGLWGVLRVEQQGQGNR